MDMNPSQPQGQTKVPPPPTPEVSVRTMQSDIRSVSQGEVNPTPEIVAPKTPAPQMNAGFSAEGTDQMLAEEGAEPKKGHRGLWALIIVGIIIALGAIGYFVIFPMMSTPAAETIVDAPAPVAVTETPVVTPAPHNSAFASAVPSISQIAIAVDPVSRETIIQQLTDQGAALPDGLTEVVLRDNAGNLITFPLLVSTILPEFLDGLSTDTYLQNEFTAYIYKDAAGVWPGYIVPLRPEGSATFSQWLSNFEKADLSALFVTSPGALAEFKDGSVKGVADRYATGATAGASLSYAATATDLHISTSFEGLKAALTALGY